MVSSDRHEAEPQRAILEARIRESPQLVGDYLRLARLLEEEGDLKSAATVLQKAHFFLPNGPWIVSEVRRLSDWIDKTPTPITIVRPDRTPESETVEDPPPEDEIPVPKVADDVSAPEQVDEDELDQLIHGLESARMDPKSAPLSDPELEWGVEDGLIATETLAHIYAAQKQYFEAAAVYDRLAGKERDPERAAAFREKASGLRKSGEKD